MARNRRTAGAFDIRSIIATLLGIYGVVLVLLGIFQDTRTTQGEAPININLWAGLAMVVVSVAFMAWVRVRPVVVPEEFEDDEEDAESR